MDIIVFTGGKAPSPKDMAVYFDDLFSFDYIICADSGLDTFQIYRDYFYGKFEITPDFIIGDMDSVKDKSLLELYKDCEKEIYPHYKDYTDTELALIKASKVVSKECSGRIILIGGDGGRLDHLLAILDTFNMDYRPDYWFTTENIAVCVQENQSLSLKNLSFEDRVSVVNPDPRIECCVETHGFEWPDELFRKDLVMSLSNRVCQEYLIQYKDIVLSVKKGKCLVLLPLDTTNGRVFL